ncbi:unnamed protein product [Mycena citricolor]|uniref:Aldehyde dehydrogenase domain-containing protein n=1 Tax=Mycena citricolor TaxID=2018698 RepID=A0AAD2GU89_9AGAR|nr:unnamed protein product [Mycena citricolor]
MGALRNLARTMAQIATVRVGSKEIKVPTGLFINNEFVPSVDSNERIESVNPFTEEVLCSVVAASPKDIDIAVAAARKAFNTTWGKNVTGFERSRLINKLADLIEQNAQVGSSVSTRALVGLIPTAQELAELEALDNGKPIRIARDYDIGDSVQIPWNYPINMWSWKVAPALATGCTIVMKPSELTPLTALKLSELVKEAGFPPGVLNTVPSLGTVGGAALSAHMDVDKVAFTGSTITGRKIMESAAKSNLKKAGDRVSLELGGKSPHIVFESCDLEQAARWAALGICYNSGQDCTAGSRVYVQDSIHDKFVAQLVSTVKELNFGDGTQDGSTAGPVVSKGQFDRIWNYIESGKQEGAKVALGGTKRTGKGFFVDPTIFTDVQPNMKIVKEEIFGPVLSIGRFETEEEAIKLANDTSYGLGAGLHSNDANQCMRVASALEAGTVWVNQYNLLSNNVPFGGKKQSGIGRELGSYALEEYTSVKAVHWNFGEKLDWPF